MSTAYLPCGMNWTEYHCGCSFFLGKASSLAEHFVLPHISQKSHKKEIFFFLTAYFNLQQIYSISKQVWRLVWLDQGVAVCYQCSGKVQIWAILELSCSKWEFLKLAPIQQSLVQFQNCTVQAVGILLTDGILHYFPNCVNTFNDKSCFLVREKSRDSFLSWQFRSCT